MTKLVALLLVAALWAGVAQAAGDESGFELRAGNDLNNIYSLQRGARNFMNYCSGCHSAKYVRYSRIAEDLDLAEKMLRENLMFGEGEVGATMIAALPAVDANRWFGVVPPDLSLIGRAKGADYVYSFLMSFYADESRPFGVDNLTVEGTGMPHVLADLQGLQAADFEPAHGSAEGGREELVFAGFRPLTEGRLSAHEYADFVRDLTNFLDYIGEPIKLERRRLGIKVLAYLTFLFLLVYALKKEFWKDVH